MESTGHYKGKHCHIADFSDDGSLLAVVFDRHLTIWDPFENQLCTALELSGGDVISAQFLGGLASNLLAVATTSSVLIWDLMSCAGKLVLTLIHCHILLPPPSIYLSPLSPLSLPPSLPPSLALSISLLYCSVFL